ncbi:MAG: 30S ribosomal protein S14 [Candidatus Diapherotrites archaeon]|uniref:30S ribosomal protein S14 n=1 Tax=Candidatus Iainarchaeum sp. TaxID=3101447 RepID=A0A2D6LP90_9ARCH|nr:30S ribosomal protein S14 [Candidatus Diapherotrites archaeon]|tara:strand:+ start:3035 stop:3193 length:159 start_codon:yes stop_codon:yes gene_type:complete
MSEEKQVKPWKVQPQICKKCGSHKGVIRKYGLQICRRCFKESAEKIGFRKYD